MTEFEVLIIPLSLILGLGVTRILTAFVHAFKYRDSGTVHWIPLLWGGSILIYLIGYFNVLFNLSQSIESWAWIQYGPVLFMSMLMFLSAGLVLPTDHNDQFTEVLEEYDKHGRFALVPLGVLLATANGINVLQGGQWFNLANYFNVLLTLVIIAAFITKRYRLKAAMAVVFFVGTILGWMLAWAQPGTV